MHATTVDTCHIGQSTKYYKSVLIMYKTLTRKNKEKNQLIV